MRCKWCNDIIDLGEPTEEMLKIEDQCPYKDKMGAYEVARWIKSIKDGKEDKELSKKIEKAFKFKVVAFKD